MSLCDRADEETGMCWPSVKTISEECELTERAVRKCLRALENLGLIATELRGDFHLVSRYRVIKQGGTVFPLTRNAVPPKGEPCSVKGAPHAPQASGSHTEATRGNGHPRFPKELKNQIKDISDEIQRLADFGHTEDEKAERLRLIARRKELKKQYFYA